MSEESQSRPGAGDAEQPPDIILTRPTFRGHPTTVGIPTATELQALSGAAVTGEIRDELLPWCLIAIRVLDGRSTKVHALGWRSMLQNTWITSALTTVDVAAGLVWTSSGHGYKLGGGVGSELSPMLREHLLYALLTWGFDDVEL